MNPRATGPHAGFDSHSSIANDPAISTISAMTSASTYRKPLCCRNSTTSTSSAVRQTPQMSGSPKSRFRAMAAPMTSARSQAAIAISHRIHKAMVVGRE